MQINTAAPRFFLRTWMKDIFVRWNYGIKEYSLYMYLQTYTYIHRFWKLGWLNDKEAICAKCSITYLNQGLGPLYYRCAGPRRKLIDVTNISISVKNSDLEISLSLDGHTSGKCLAARPLPNPPGIANAARLVHIAAVLAHHFARFPKVLLSSSCRHSFFGMAEGGRVLFLKKRNGGETRNPKDLFSLSI